jgi:hypothetical protein
MIYPCDATVKIATYRLKLGLIGLSHVLIFVYINEFIIKLYLILQINTKYSAN